MTRSCEQLDRQKALHPFPSPKSMGEARRDRGEGIRKFAEVRGSSMEVHEGAPRVRKYTLLLSRGSSYGRSSSPVERSEISVALIPGFHRVRNADGANERTNELALVRYEIGGSRHKNFNLDIFRINEPRRTRIQHEPMYFLCEPSLCTRVLYNITYISAY